MESGQKAMKFSEWVFTISLLGIIIVSSALMSDKARWGLLALLLAVVLVSGVILFGKATERR